MNETTANQTTTPAMSMPNLLLRSEGLIMLLGAIALYANQGASGLMFVILLLTPDLGILGYQINPQVGSVAYNALHTFALPALLAALGLAGQWPLGTQLALIWFAHIGADRLLGFGLKYPTTFKDSHMQHV